jgi:HAD superfamily hydrolase (TIGR01509 family)
MVQNGRNSLNELNSKGYCLGLVTSGSQLRVLREIEQFELTSVFQAVVCNEDVIEKKPHPEGLTAAMSRLGKKPGVCCYVGDSPDDIEMGKRAMVRTIGILSSYPNSKKLSHANPDLCLENLDQLLGHFINNR